MFNLYVIYHIGSKMSQNNHLHNDCRIYQVQCNMCNFEYLYIDVYGFGVKKYSAQIIPLENSNNNIRCSLFFLATLKVSGIM